MVNFEGLFCEQINKKNCFSSKKLGFKIIENGTILPRKDLILNGKWNWGAGGIIDAQGNFVESSFVVDCQMPEIYTPKEEISYFSETVIYLTMYYHVYGHLITDEIRRVWFFKTDTYKKHFQSCPIIIGIVQGGYIAPQFMQILKILEVDLSEIRIINKPAKFKNIVFPDDSFKREMFTTEYIETVEQIRHYAQKNFTKIPQKKFFFYHDRHVAMGNERLAKYFDSKGYAVIKPENFSIDDQLNILQNCERFASTVGSCSHNSIFLKDHAEVLLIPRYVKSVNNTVQIVLDQMHDKNTFYVDTALSVFSVGSGGPFCYLISPQLKSFFADKGTWTTEDFEIFIQYVNYAIEKNFEPLEESKQYYSNIMKDFIKGMECHNKLIKSFKYLRYLKENFL